MKFRNYCVIIMGETNGVSDEVRKIAETEPNFLETKGITIATFTSFVSPSELTEWFKENKRNVIVFDLNPKVSGVHFMKQQIQEALFGFLKNVDLDDMNQQFIDEVETIEKYDVFEPDFSGDTITNILSEKAIVGMNKKEKEDLLNKLIENGLDKLTEDDKKLLSLLAK